MHQGFSCDCCKQPLTEGVDMHRHYDTNRPEPRNTITFVRVEDRPGPDAWSYARSFVEREASMELCVSCMADAMGQLNVTLPEPSAPSERQVRKKKSS